MKKGKRALALVLAAAMTATSLTACGTKEEPSATGAETTAAAEIEQTAASETEDNLPKPGETIHGFTVDQVTRSAVYDADVFVLTHQKTGGQVMYIANEDTNRAFNILFRTPGSDTGISHVFEHTCLFGSEKYPADIFLSVKRQTANTFMNAQTDTRDTIYQVSSISDEQLLKLADLYLDGVFHPTILTDRSKFDREAWRYELASPEDELTLTGTVYSEMKGLLSFDNRSVFNILRTVFPGSTCGVITGGDTEVIPTLTHEEVVEYHEKYYKPSNALAILYGKLDYEKYLELIDQYFSEGDDQKVEITDDGYTPITGAIETETTLPGSGDATIYYVFPAALETEKEYFAFMSMVGLMNQQAFTFNVTMQQELPEVAAGVMTLNKGTEPLLIFVASNMDPKDKETFKRIADESIQKITEQGFDEDEIEMFTSSMQRTIIETAQSTENIGIEIAEMTSPLWTYYGDPAAALNYTEYFANLSDHLDNEALKKMAKTYLVDAGRSALIVNLPDENLAVQNEAALKEKLAEIKAGMSKEEIAQIVADTAAAAETQEDPKAAEYVKEINVSTVDGLKAELENYKPKEYEYTDETVDQVRYLSSETNVGEYGKAALYFDVSSFTEEQLQYLSLYGDLGGMLPGKEASTAEIYQNIMRYGSYSASLVSADDKTYYRVDLGMMNDDIDQAYEALYALMFDVDLGDTDYLAAVITRAASSQAQSLVSSSSIHQNLSKHMRARRDAAGALDEATTGLTYYDFLKQTTEEMEADPDGTAAKLSEVIELLQNKAGAVVAYAGNEEGIRKNQEAAGKFFKDMSGEERAAVRQDFGFVKQNEAVIIGQEMNYNGIYATKEDLGGALDGGMDVMDDLMYASSLITQLRFIKGAYDCIISSTMNDTRIIAYRDPQLKDTYEYYDTLGSQIEAMDLTEDDLTGYYASGFIDATTRRSAFDSVYHFLTSRIEDPDEDEKAYEWAAKLLETDVEKVKSYAQIYEDLVKNGTRCTFGTEKDIIANADLFDQITIPFGDGRIAIYIDGSRVETEMPPIIEGDHVLVPLKTIAKELGASVSQSKEEGVIVKYNHKMNLLHIGSDEMITEGKASALVDSVEQIDDQILIPLSAVTGIFGRSAEWKGGCVIIQ